MIDEQGSTDLNCYGAADLQTPNLDKLAGDISENINLAGREPDIEQIANQM